MYEFRGNGTIPVVVGHASTEIHYTERSTLLHFLKPYASTVYTFDLPGHGSNATEDILSPNELFAQFSEILDTVPEERYMYIGYSLGGILGQKYLSGKESRGIYIGTGLRITESASLITQFFDPSNFKHPHTQKLMRLRHGDHWMKLIESLQQALIPGSILFPDQDQIRSILQGDHHYILSKEDQAFSKSDINFVGELDIFEVPGNHFTYFHQKIGWPLTKKRISELSDLGST